MEERRPLLSPGDGAVAGTCGSVCSDIRHINDESYRSLSDIGQPSINDGHIDPSNKNIDKSLSIETTTYKRRWYLLLLFVTNGVIQGVGYNCWGPISESALSAFHWSNSDLAMMPNWANISFCLVILPSSWLMDVKGLRSVSVISAALLVLSSGLRCLPFHPLSQLYKWAVFVGQIVSGLAAILSCGGPALFSSTWFAPNQRTLSTTVSAGGPILGSALSFIIGPLMVPNYNTTSWTNRSSSTMEPFGNGTDITQEQHDIMVYMYAQLIASAVFFILVLVYFPSRPPKFPSISATTDREDFLIGLKDLCVMPSFWLVALSMATLGVSFGWVSVMDIDMWSENITQIEIGWIGFWSQLAGVFVSIPVAWCTGIYSGRLKLITMISLTLTTAFFALFTAMNQPLIGLPPTTALLYLSTIGSTIFQSVAYPLFYELGCEVVYPVAEGVTSGLLSIINNLSGTIFFFVFFIPNIGTVWIDWAVLGTMVLGVVSLAVVKVKYRRSEVDTKVNILPTEEISVIHND